MQALLHCCRTCLVLVCPHLQVGLTHCSPRNPSQIVLWCAIGQWYFKWQTFSGLLNYGRLPASASCVARTDV